MFELVFLALVVAVPIALVALLATLAWRRGRAPKTAEGDYVLHDIADKPGNAGLATLAGGAFALALLAAGLANLGKGFALAGAGYVAGALLAGGFTFLLARGQRQEAALADAGEVRVAAWPLKRGERATLRFRRKLHVQAGLGPPEAALVLTENPNNAGRATLRRLPLDAGALRVEGGALVAAWELDLPDPHDGQDAASTRFRHLRWHLEVTVPVAGAPLPLGSHIELPIQA